MAATFQWLEQQSLPEAEGASIGFDTNALCLLPLLDGGFRTEAWMTQRNRPAGRRYQRHRRRQGFERTHKLFAAGNHEELKMMSRIRMGRCVAMVSPWWAEKFRVADNFSQEELPFAAFWPTQLFRPTIAVFPVMVTDMTCITAKNLLRFANQERRLYRLSTQLYELIVGMTAIARTVLAGERNLEDARSRGWIGLTVPWDEMVITWKMGNLPFDPWAR